MSLLPYKRNAEVEKKVLEELLRGVPSSPPLSGAIQGTTYKDVIFEALAYRKPKETNKELFTFDKSCERLVLAGFKRHPLPAEVFSLIIDVLEGKVSASLLSVKEDFFKNYGEWFDLVFKPKNGVLHCYEQPRNVVCIPNDYDCSKMIFDQEKKFPLNGLPLKTYIPIKDVAKKSHQIVTYIWSRPFEKLPSEIQNNANLWIPDSARPVGRDDYGIFNVSGNYYWASRGVR